MKRFAIIGLFLIGAASYSVAQPQLISLDRSPMDMAYCPNDYPILRIQHKATVPPEARIIYSRPQKNGRVVFGELVEYSKVWRLGANEATEIDLYEDARVGDKKLKKGRYTMYAIPQPDKWTIIFNKATDTWGAFQYDDQKDVVRVDAPTGELKDPVEVFTMEFEKEGDTDSLIMAWDNVKVTLPFTFSQAQQ